MRSESRWRFAGAVQVSHTKAQRHEGTKKRSGPDFVSAPSRLRVRPVDHRISGHRVSPIFLIHALGLLSLLSNLSLRPCGEGHQRSACLRLTGVSPVCFSDAHARQASPVRDAFASRIDRTGIARTAGADCVSIGAEVGRGAHVTYHSLSPLRGLAWFPFLAHSVPGHRPCVT